MTATLINGMDHIEFDAIIAGKYTLKVQNAKKRGIHFDLSIAQFRNAYRRKHCAYTGAVLTFERGDLPQGQLPRNYATLERVDANKGYTIDNVVVISHEANSIKAVFENPAPGSNMNVDAAIRMFAKIAEMKNK